MPKTICLGNVKGQDRFLGKVKRVKAKKSAIKNLDAVVIVWEWPLFYSKGKSSHTNLLNNCIYWCPSSLSSSLSPPICMILLRAGLLCHGRKVRGGDGGTHWLSLILFSVRTPYIYVRHCRKNYRWGELANLICSLSSPLGVNFEEPSCTEQAH